MIKMTIWKSSFEYKFYLSLGVLLLVYVFSEAWLMPLTHDELSTIGFSKQSIFDILSYKDPIPNNHILNTLLLKLNIAIFGDNLLTNRLPNIMAFILYYLFSVKLAFRIGNDFLFRTGLVITMTMQPFLFDFFSVSRGYGLSLGFMSMSLYYMADFIKKTEISALFKSLVSAAIGVMASFTLLNYYLPLIFILFITIILKPNSSKSNELMKKSFLVMFCISLVLAGLCFTPFSKMMQTDQFQYWGSNSFYKDTFTELLYSMRSGIHYFRWDKEVYALVGLMIFLVIAFSGIYSFLLKKSKDPIFLSFISLFVLVILYNNMQHYLIGVPFLNARTSLFFIPLFSIVLVLSIQQITIIKEWLGVILICSTSLLTIQHFFRGCNPKANFEWYQDGDTYNVLKEINNIIFQESMPRPVKIDCHWLFHPSLTYHIEQNYKGIMEVAPYHKEINHETNALFYYTVSDEQEVLKSKFEPVREYSWKSRYILQAKKR